jgi:hypothetical protein
MARPLQNTRKRKYQEEFIKYGFTSLIIDGEETPQGTICYEVQACELFWVNTFV